MQAIGALNRLRSEKKLPAEKRRESHFLSNHEREKWIEDYVERETAGESNRVEYAEAPVLQAQEVEDKELEQGKLWKDDEPGWVMGTITKVV